jgi:hypothetical protein
MNSKITNSGKDYDGLSQRDLDNLNFLLTSSKSTIKQWMQVVSQDDLNYALELMAMYHLRLCDSAAEQSELNEAREMLANIGIPTSKTRPDNA